jgi:hypothetical protein
MAIDRNKLRAELGVKPAEPRVTASSEPTAPARPMAAGRNVVAEPLAKGQAAEPAGKTADDHRKRIFLQSP